MEALEGKKVLKEDERPMGGGKLVSISRAREHVVRIFVSCLGFVLAGAHLISEFLEVGSLTGLLQHLAKPTMIFYHILLFLSIPAFVLVGYFYKKQKNLAENLEQIVEERTSRLHESQTKLENIFAVSPDAITVSDLNGNISEYNQATLDMHGFSSKEELIGKSAFELIAEKDRERALENLKKTLERGSVRDIEYTFLTKDGREFPAELSASVVRDTSGNPTYFVAITKDITERKRAEETLRESEEKYRAIVESSPNFIGIVQDGVLKYVNSAMCERLGWTFEEMTSPSFNLIEKLVPVRFQDRAKENVAKRLRGGHISPYEINLKKRDGSEIPVIVYAQKILYQGKTADEVILVDVTERKRMEERIVYLASIVDNAKVAIATVDMNGIVTYCNRATEEMLGWTSKEFIGKPMARFCPTAGKQIEATMKEGFCLDKELEYVKKDGSPLPGSTSTFLIRDKDGNPVGIGGIAIDITDRKKAEEMLRESEEKYRVLVESAADAIFTVNEAGDFLSANQEAARTMGKTPEDMISKNMYALFPKDIADFQMARIKAVFQTGNPILADENMTQTKFGQRWYSTTVMPIRDSNGKIIYVMGTARDVTERKKIEEKLKEYTENLEKIVEERTRKLKEAERLAAIGETAAMVGHDLRNPLQVIANTTYLGEERVKSMPSPCRELAEKKGVYELFGTVGEQVEYMNKIVSDLQDYARPLKPELVETSLHQLINDTLSTITAPETVKVSMEIEGDLDFPKLMVDPTMMKRVFINLVTNAVQAMPDGGKMTIRASKTNEAAFISVQDTGVGIPEENLDKLFHPLFTTKSKGTGFGLPVCKRMVEAHDGNITVESKAGRGATFTVKIPLRREVS